MVNLTYILFGFGFCSAANSYSYQIKRGLNWKIWRSLNNKKKKKKCDSNFERVPQTSKNFLEEVAREPSQPSSSKAKF